MPIEQPKVAELHLIFGPYAYYDKVPGVTGFTYTDEAEVTRRGAGNFGNNGPLEITESYQGVAGSFTIEGSEGEDIVQAIISGVDPSTFTVDNPKKRFPFYIIGNAYEEDGTTPLRGHFINFAKIAGTPAQIGPDARTYNFQGKTSKRSKGRKMAYQVFNGNATPVTVLTLTNAALQDDDSNYALLVLRQTQGTKTVKILKKTTDYTETSSAITLISGLTATEKAIVVYIANPT